jgi:hypothetical protein
MLLLSQSHLNKHINITRVVVEPGWHIGAFLIAELPL